MHGLVLAAGRGVRMRPLSLERPKVLFPTLDIPQLAWALAAVADAGVDRAWVNAHDDPSGIEAAGRAAGERLGLRVALSHERGAPLGTAGALRKLRDELSGPLLVVNADVATDAPLGHLIETHRSAGAVGTLFGVPAEGVVDLRAEDGRVTGLVDRRAEQAVAVAGSRGYRYAGMGIFDDEVLGWIPPGPSGLFEAVFREALRRGRKLALIPWDGYWRDVGTPADHLKANLDALSGALPARGIPEALGRTWSRRDAAACVAEGAEVEGVHLVNAVVGRGARLARGTRLERCVVWEGAAPPAGSYRDAILTPRQLLRLA